MRPNIKGNILFICHDASRTGAPIFLLRFLQWFKEHREIPFRILIGRNGELVSAFEHLGPTDLFEPPLTKSQKVLRRLGFRVGDPSGYKAALRNKLAQSNIRLVYSNTIANGAILDFLSFLDCRVVCHVHELEFAVSHLGLDNLEMVKKYASSYIAVSNSVKRNLVDNHGLPEKDVRVIHGFIPISDKQLGMPGLLPKDIRKELDIPADAKIVCGCGSVDPRKGPDLFLEVARRITQISKPMSVHFVWVGGRPELLTSLRKATRSLSLQTSVHFIGHRDDVKPYYEASDIFLLSSREDPFPLVMLEAALASKPIVCFDNSGGGVEFVEHDAGASVPGFDVDEMAETIMQFLRSDELRRKTGSIARQKVLSRHDLDAKAPEVARVIEDALLMSENGAVTHSV